MADTHALATLVQALKGLPGVGIKSAQRMAFQLLQNSRVALVKAKGSRALKRKGGPLHDQRRVTAEIDCWGSRVQELAG